ncbi:hypothetical protein LTR08_004190 [Meristemomyces frigidus]|nr:hypothetical protein LTR08_004190 [Meristemomyces frigidus]
MYGLDADLIMLGIATHEPHFRILREDVFASETKPGHCRKCNQPGHMADQCRGGPKPKTGEDAIKAPLKPFIWLHVSVLREYLAVEMSVPGQPFRFDLERALDDWVFMCFFVGNDFLPHLPSLDIREDGIDTLIAIWRDNIPVMGGYVTKDGHVDLARAQTILEGLAKQEDAIFKRRHETQVRKDAGAKRREEQQSRRDSSKRQRMSHHGSGFDETVIRRGPKGGVVRGEQAPDINALPTFAPGQAQTRSDPRFAAQANLTHADIVGNANKANKSAAAALKEQLLASKKPVDNQKAELEALFAAENGGQPLLGKRTRDMIDDVAGDSASSAPSTPGRNTPNKEIADPLNNGKGSSGALGGTSKPAQEMPEDTVLLWEPGYQGRYYSQKFSVDAEDASFRHQVARAYVEGLCWVLLYYFQGCPSWTWYYPYHYAPFASDFVDMSEQVVAFDKGKPFRPYEQLMGVMPALSNHTIPTVFHPLMVEDESPIKEFYPVDFEVDLNGKKFAWQGVALLPFIDEKRLLDAMATKYPMLTPDEVRRNAFGDEALIFSTKHPLYDEVATNFYSKKASSAKYKLNSRISEGLAGKIAKEDSYIPHSALHFPLPDSEQEEWGSLEQDDSVTVAYHMPAIKGVHKSMLLPGVAFADPVLDYGDVQATREMARKSGRSFGGVQLSERGGRSDGRRIDYGGGGRDGGGGGGQGRDHGNGGGNGYGANGGYGSGAGQQQQQAYPPLPPHLAQQALMHGFPPPPGGMPPGGMPPGRFPPGMMPGMMPPGYPPGMPPQQQQQQSQGGYGGYGAQQGGYQQGGGHQGGGGASYGGQQGYGGGGGRGYGGGNGYQNGNGNVRGGNGGGRRY